MSDARLDRGAPGYARAVSLISLGGVANVALLYYVQPLLPTLAGSFGVTPGASGLALSATTLAMIGGLLIAAPLTRRIGRSTAVWVSLLATGVISALSVAAPGWEVFVASRLVVGVGLAILPAAALAYVKDAVVDGAHLGANAAYIAGTAVGGALGRVAPLPLAVLGGWQLPTLVFSGFSVVTGLVLAVALPRDRVAVRVASPADAAGRRGIRDSRLLLVCGLGLVNSAVFVTVYNAIGFRLDAPPFELGGSEALVYLAYVACILSPAAFGAVAVRRGREGAVALGLGVVVVAVAVLVPSTVVTVFAGLTLLTFAYLGVHSMLSGWATRRGHEIGLDTSRASSAYLIAFYLGSTLASAVATALWAVAGWPGITLLSAVLLGVAAVLSVGLARRR